MAGCIADDRAADRSGPKKPSMQSRPTCMMQVHYKARSFRTLLNSRWWLAGFLAVPSTKELITP